MPNVENRVQIRKAGLADVPGIAQLINAYAASGIMLPRTEFELAENIRDFMVAEKEKSIVGCVALHIYTIDSAEVRSLAVSPEQKGGGTGRRLLEYVEREALELGLSSLFAFTYVEGFFARLGFATISREAIPGKAWRDCLKCPKFKACDEIAVLKIIHNSTKAKIQPHVCGDLLFSPLPITKPTEVLVKDRQY